MVRTGKGLSRVYRETTAVVVWALMFVPGALFALDSGIVRDGLHTTAPHERLLAASPATDGQGNWVAAYSAAEGVRCLRSWDNATSWTDDVLIFLPTADGVSTSSHAQTVTDGHGLWLTFWCTYDTLGGTKGADRDIVYASSTDNGATWSPPQLVDPGAQSDSADDAWQSVATDGNGNWVCLWQSGRGPGGAPSAQDAVMCARSADNGATWSAPSDLAVFDATQYPYVAQPCIATDTIGHWAAVWTSGTVQFSRSTDTGGSWSVPVELASGPWGAGVSSRVAISASGRAMAAWSNAPQLGQHSVQYRGSADHGASWSALGLGPSSSTSIAAPLTLAMDSSGIWFAGGDIAGDTVSPGQAFYIETVGSWTVTLLPGWDPQTSVTPTVRGVAVANSGSGRFVGLWESSPTTTGTVATWSIHAGHQDGFGSALPAPAGWSPPDLIHPTQETDSADDQFPDVAYHGYGHCVAVWQSGGSDPMILCSSRLTPQGLWTPPEPLLPDMISTETSDTRPRIACRPDGLLMAVWARKQSGGDYDIVASRSFDGGLSWSPAITVNTDALTDSLDDGCPSVAFGPAGACAVAWVRVQLSVTDSSHLVARSFDSGDTWEPAVFAGSISRTPGTRWATSSETAWSGGCWLTSGETDGFELRATSGLHSHAARSADGGISWSPLSADLGFPWACTCSVAAQGPANAVMLYTLPGNYSYPDELWSVASVDSGATWLQRSCVSVVAGDEPISLVGDGYGKWRTVWSGRAVGAVLSDHRILLSESTDTGQHWSQEADLAATSGNNYNARIATDGQGNWTVVWHARNQPDADIMWTSLTESPPSGTAARDWQMLE